MQKRSRRCEESFLLTVCCIRTVAVNCIVSVKQALVLCRITIATAAMCVASCCGENFNLLLFQLDMLYYLPRTVAMFWPGLFPTILLCFAQTNSKIL